MNTGYLLLYGITRLPTHPLNLACMQVYSYCKSRLRLIRAKFREEGKATRKVEKLEVELSDGREES